MANSNLNTEKIKRPKQSTRSNKEWKEIEDKKICKKIKKVNTINDKIEKFLKNYENSINNINYEEIYILLKIINKLSYIDLEKIKSKDIEKFLKILKIFVNKSDFNWNTTWLLFKALNPFIVNPLYITDANNIIDIFIDKKLDNIKDFTWENIWDIFKWIRNISPTKKLKKFINDLLNKKLNNINRINENDIWNIFIWFRELNSSIIDKDIIENLKNKISSINKINWTNISHILHWLQWIDSSSYPKELLIELNKKLNKKSKFTWKELWKALYWFKNLDSDSISIELINKLIDKISEVEIEIKDISIAIFWIQNLDETSWINIEKMLILIEKKIFSIWKKLNGQHIWNILFGLQWFKNNITVSNFSKKLADFININQIKDSNDAISILRWTSVLWIELKNNIKKHCDILIKNEQTTSTIEENFIFNYLNEKNWITNIRKNFFIDWFELDIYFEKNGKKYNIELDGKHHIDEKNRDYLRDKYLSSKWIIIISIRNSDIYQYHWNYKNIISEYIKLD